MKAPEHFESVVGGKRYSVATAMLLAGDDYWDGNNYERQAFGWLAGWWLGDDYWDGNNYERQAFGWLAGWWLGNDAGIDNLSPHDLRHDWATRAVARAPLSTVQAAGGWASPVMPLRYAAAGAIANDGLEL